MKSCGEGSSTQMKKRLGSRFTFYEFSFSLSLNFRCLYSDPTNVDVSSFTERTAQDLTEKIFKQPIIAAERRSKHGRGFRQMVVGLCSHSRQV